MLAADTNLIVRFLTRDDARQFAKVDALIRNESIYVCATVLLETEWVLGSAYGYTRARIVEALRDFAGLRHVIMEDAAAVAEALEWSAGGMDFADALHLARTRHCEAFVTFDRRLARMARSVASLTVRPP